MNQLKKKIIGHKRRAYSFFHSAYKYKRQNDVAVGTQKIS